MARKINRNMSIMDSAMIMSEGNPGAISIIMDMITTPTGSLDLLLLDSLDIRGSRLYMLHNDCCGCDPDKFSRTLMMLRCGVFTTEQIHANLERYRALPFIDDTIYMEDIPPYGEDFGPTHPKWDEWCEAQKKSFQDRSA